MENRINKFLILIVCILLIIILALALSPQQSSNVTYYNDATIHKYLAYLGTEIQTDSDGNATLDESTEFIEGLKNIELCDILGTGTHGINDDIISEFKWASNSAYNDSIYNSFVDDMNEYIGSSSEIADYEGYSNTTNVWIDRANNYMILAWADGNKIYVSWFYEEDYLSNSSYEYMENDFVAPEVKNKYGHLCEECGEEATYTIDGITGRKEYYCSKHYQEMQGFLKEMLKIYDTKNEITGSGKFYGN